MARVDKAATNLQVFRGSRSAMDVFTKSALEGECCGSSDLTANYDKLAQRVRFDNGLNHLDPLGGKEEYVVPTGSPGFASTEESIVSWINGNGVGATISVIAIPTYAFVTGVGVHIDAEEAGLTFNLKTRNGLALPSAKTIQVTATGSACDITRTQGDGSFSGFGALSGAAFIDIFGRDGNGEFSLEADEIMLEVATMPTSGTVAGSFNITVSAAYEVIHRAEA